MLLGLDQNGIAAHSGSSCSSESLAPSPVLAAMGVDAERSLRLSVGWSTTDDDVEAFAGGVPARRDRSCARCGLEPARSQWAGRVVTPPVVVGAFGMAGTVRPALRYASVMIDRATWTSDTGGPSARNWLILRDGTGGVSLGQEHRPQIQVRGIGAGVGALCRLLLVLGTRQHRRVARPDARFELEPPGLGQRLGLVGVLREHLQIEAERAGRVRLTSRGSRPGPGSVATARPGSGSPSPTRSGPGVGNRSATPRR